MEEHCYYKDGCKVAQFPVEEQREAWTAIELLDSSLYHNLDEMEQSTQAFLTDAMKAAVETCRRRRAVGDCIAHRPATLRNNSTREIYFA